MAKNYILEIDRETCIDIYSEEGTLIVMGNVVEYEDELDDIPTMYIKVKRNIKEPVYIETIVENWGTIGDTGVLVPGEIEKKRLNANGKCIGRTLKFNIFPNGATLKDVEWFGFPMDTKKVEKLCGTKKKIYMC